MNAMYDTKDKRCNAEMKTATAQVRPAFFILLLMAILGSGAMKLLAQHAKQEADPDFQKAVYRYNADDNQECVLWSGHVRIPVLTEEGGMLWVRLPQPPIRDIATGVCPVPPPTAM